MSSIKETLVKIYAKYVVKKTEKWSKKPVETQEKVMKKLISKAKKTKFGKDHNFDKISTYRDFIKEIPVRDYEGIKTYIDKVVQGKKNILWPGKPIYFAKILTRQKHRAPLLAKNTFQSLKIQCLFILKDLWRQQCITY